MLIGRCTGGMSTTAIPLDPNERIHLQGPRRPGPWLVVGIECRLNIFTAGRSSQKKFA
jgi:hypothetical protein